MHGILKGAQFVIDRKVYQADLEFRGYALDKGVSTEVRRGRRNCRCWCRVLLQ